MRDGILRRQRGKGRFGFIIAVLIVAAAVYVAVKLVPVKVRTYQFADFMREEAQRAAWNKNEQTLREHLLEKAAMLGLPVTAKNLQIKMGGGEIRVSARYEVPVDLMVTTYVWKVDQEERAPLF